MMAYVKLWQYLTEFLAEWEMFHTDVAEEI